MKNRMMSSRCFKGVAALLFGLVLGAPCAAASGQKTFASPEIAVETLVDSLARNDDAEMRAILGIQYDYLLPLDNLTEEDRLAFLGAWAKGHRILRDSDTVAHLEVSSGWTLPIPVVRSGNNWVFDTRAGKEEMRIRRIGRNELAAIETLYTFVEMQREYAAPKWRPSVWPAPVPGGHKTALAPPGSPIQASSVTGPAWQRSTTAKNWPDAASV